MRFDENAITLGVESIINIIKALNMLDAQPVLNHKPIYPEMKTGSSHIKEEY